MLRSNPYVKPAPYAEGESLKEYIEQNFRSLDRYLNESKDHIAFSLGAGPQIVPIIVRAQSKCQISAVYSPVSGGVTDYTTDTNNIAGGLADYLWLYTSLDNGATFTGFASFPILAVNQGFMPGSTTNYKYVYTLTNGIAIYYNNTSKDQVVYFATSLNTATVTGAFLSLTAIEIRQ